ncbi:CzcE family metal-binding protein [Undibacterium arcticum]|uniref:CzcE family metal-binding protein n=1 Tax=Undibacterium arcticum TaxID=1762892 RepID=A0ABV7EXX1_9BURK
MNQKLLLPSIFTVMLSAACVSPIDTRPRLDLLGDPAPVSAATRTIVIAPNAKYVNVTGGETVKFVVGDKSFAWYFDGPEDVSSFDLNRIAPSGVLDHAVIAYVAPNPLYMGDGDHHGHGAHGGGGHDGSRK